MVRDLGLPFIIEKYFFSGYTLFNTLVYGFILVVMLLLIIKMFKKLDINPENIIFSLIPFILLGSLTRALVDNSILPYNVFLITPGIYFLVGFLTIFSLLFSVYIFKKTNFDYRYTLVILGIIFDIFPILLINHINSIIFFQVCSLWILWTLIFLLIGRYWDLFKNKVNLAIMSVHLLDGTTTFIAVDFYGYLEQHVLPGAIYNIFHSAITMYPLKISVIIFSIYLIEKYIDDKNIAGLLKLTIFVLGFAPGLRNLLTMAIGIF